MDRKDVTEYRIYRSTNAQPTSLWKVIMGDNTAVEDKEVTPGNTYQYGVRVVLKDGRLSGWKEVTVAY
jgi:hypothetical protein